MARCILWQLVISVLMFMNSFILVFESGYYFKSGNLLLPLLLILMGCIFFLCGLFIYLNSFIAYQPPKTNKDYTLPKRVRFSSLQQVHEHDEQTIADGSNHGFLEEVQQSDEVTTVDGTSNDANESRDNVEIEDILFTPIAEIYSSPEGHSVETKEFEVKTDPNIPIREDILEVRGQTVQCQNLLKQFQDKIRHERYKSIIDNVYCFRRCLHSFDDYDSDDSNDGEIRETAL